MLIPQIYEAIIYFLKITVQTQALWIVIPLAISTLLMIVYFGIYKEERTDWNTHLSNSFVLIFVSIALLRYIYGINDAGAMNFIDQWQKMCIVILFFAMGLYLVRFNFEHLLPMKFARYINSPLTVNLGAYAIIMLIYSTRPFSLISLISVLIIVFALIGILILVKMPMKRISNYMEKEKEKERITNLKEAIFEIKELKGELRERKRELKEIKQREIEKGKSKLSRLKRILR